LSLILRLIISMFYAFIGGLFGGIVGFVLVHSAFRFGLDPQMNPYAGAVIIAGSALGAGLAVLGYLRQKLV